MAASGVSNRATLPMRMVRTRDVADLALLAEPDVVAVVVESDTPPWFAELEAHVRNGRLDVGRLFVPHLPAADVLGRLRDRSALGGLPAPLAAAMSDDLGLLLELADRLSGAARLQLRFMTLQPNRRYGFHVDTTTDRRPAVRVLRVYTGPGAEYVDPGDVTSQVDYYREFLLRDRVSRAVPDSAWDRDQVDARVLRQLAEIDARPAFLRDGAAVQRVPDGAVVAVKCIPRVDMWPGAIAAGRTAGWIHRSPASGAVRCFAAVSS